MLKEFKKEYFLSHRGCYDRDKMLNLVTDCQLKLNKDYNSTISIQEFLDWNISIKDKFYFVRNYCELTIKQKQWLALMCAKVSLKIYEAKYPNDKRIANCIEANEKFLNGTITLEQFLPFKSAAADAANAAANAAAYAAYAADAANAAANAAAYVAAYAADAADKVHTNNLLQALKDFCKEQ